jgi:hypothetical protein
MFGFVILFPKDVPARRLRELRNDGEKYDEVDLHGDDWYPPGPIAFLSKVVSEDHVEDEGHVETEYIGLEFLCKGHAAGVVFLRFGGVDGDNGVSAT